MLTGINPIINLTSKELGSIAKDSIKCAEAVNLVYVKDVDPGIKRVQKGSEFQYVLKNRKLSAKKELERIKNLVIPPAWQNVWICLLDNGHLQATGLDLKNRKQYRYHPLWNSLRNHTKFNGLLDFGKCLPTMRLQIEKDICLPGLPSDKVLALVVSLMERTNIRVGNGLYEKLYGSYGLTTLKDKHVKFSGSNVQFTFVGKKGIRHSITIDNKRLSNLVKKCRDIPGKELFQFVDDDNKCHSIDSGMVNDYIKRISNKDFSAKDFRTWSGTIHALLAFKSLGCCESETESKKRVHQALDIVSKHLGNTRNVCRKYYVHPVLISLFEEQRLDNYFKALDKIEINDNKADLTAEEKVLLKILAKESTNPQTVIQ